MPVESHFPVEVLGDDGDGVDVGRPVGAGDEVVQAQRGEVQRRDVVTVPQRAVVKSQFGFLPIMSLAKFTSPIGASEGIHNEFLSSSN